MIKDETKRALAEKDTPYRQALLRYLASIMTADEFAQSFFDGDKGEWTDKGEEIADAFEADLPEPEEYTFPHDEADLLHEAICEGLRQDAIDILNDLFGEYRLRSVAEQRNLFPGRVPA